MNHARLTLALSALAALIAGLFSAPASVYAQEPTPQGTAWRYKIEVAVTKSNESKDKTDIEANIYRIPGTDTPYVLIACVMGEDPEFPRACPISSALVDKKGEIIVDLEFRPNSVFTNRVLPIVDPGIPAKRLAAANTGTESRAFPCTTLFGEVPVNYETTIEKTPRHKITLAEPRTAQIGSLRRHLDVLEHKYEYDEKGAMTVGTWHHKSRTEMPTGEMLTDELRMRATLVEQRALKEDEIDRIRAEYSDIEKIVLAVYQGNPKALKGLDKKLDAVEARYREKGRLVPSAFITLQETITARTMTAEQRRNPEKAIKKKVLSKTAPDFTLKNLAGEDIKISAFKGKVVLVNFWSSSCRSCRAEAPILTTLQNKYREQGLVVLGVNAYNEAASAVQGFKDTLGLEHELLLGGNPVARKLYFCPDYPANFWIDRKGKVVHYEIGWDRRTSPQMLEDKIVELLK